MVQDLGSARSIARGNVMASEDWQVLQAMYIVQQCLNNFMSNLDWHDYISSLWMNDRAYNRIPIFTIFETNSEIIFSAIIPYILADSLEIQVTDEVVIIRGEERKSEKDDDYYKLEFGSSQFESIIPLPKLIQPQTAIARLKNNILTLVALQKTSRSRRPVPVKILNY
jgi:HSP20 family molecular chaperone IbpA